MDFYVKNAYKEVNLRVHVTTKKFKNIVIIHQSKRYSVAYIHQWSKILFLLQAASKVLIEHQAMRTGASLNMVLHEALMEHYSQCK